MGSRSNLGSLGAGNQLTGCHALCPMACGESSWRRPCIGSGKACCAHTIAARSWEGWEQRIQGGNPPLFGPPQAGLLSPSGVPWLLQLGPDAMWTLHLPECTRVDSEHKPCSRGSLVPNQGPMKPTAVSAHWQPQPTFCLPCGLCTSIPRWPGWLLLLKSLPGQSDNVQSLQRR